MICAKKNNQLKIQSFTFKGVGTGGTDMSERVDGSITNLDISNATEIIPYACYNCTKIGSVTLNPEITSLGEYSFYNVGLTRNDPTNNILDYDFSGGTFTTVPQYAFVSMIYAKMKLPETLTSLGQNSFMNMFHSDLYMNNFTALSYINTFSNMTSSNIIVPYSHLLMYRVSTNWVKYASNIIGYADTRDFTPDTILPGYDNGGNILKWYDDKALTNEITTMPSSGEAYCDVRGLGATNVVVEQQLHCDLIITDRHGNHYDETHPIPYGTVVTITAVGDEYHPILFKFRINGVDANLGYTFVSMAGVSLSIFVQFWDGDNPPYDFVFGRNSWADIAETIRSGTVPEEWNLGDEKEITLTNGELITCRICDKTANRYEYSDGSGYTRMVIEFKNCLADRGGYTYSNAGGWDSSEFRTRVNSGVIWNLLPSDLQNVLKEVKTKAMNGGSQPGVVLTESDDKLFLASEREIFGTNTYSAQDEWDSMTRFQLYANNDTNAFRIKTVASSDYAWWLRSASSISRNDFVSINQSGAVSTTDAIFGIGVSLFFAF